MAQPTLDDSIENLERFCNLLGQTSAVVTRDAEVLAGRRDSLEQTEAAARERAEHVAERLATALDELTEAQADAVEEVDRLTQAAGDLAASGLSAAGKSLESNETAFAERLNHDRAALEKDFLDLSEGGFTSLGTVIDEVEAELTRAEESAGQALEDLERGLTEVGRQTAEARTETVAAFEDVEQTLRDGEAQELEQQVAEHTTLWTEDLPEAAQAECASIGDPLEALYRDWEAEVVDEGDELADAVAVLLQGAIDDVASEAGQPLAAAFEETTSDSFRALAGEQEGLLPVLAEGEVPAEAAAALVDDLAVARQVVGQIDRVLNAMAK